MNSSIPLNPNQISAAVEDVLGSTPFIDIHTHLFMPSLGELGLWGIDELVTYHYLEAELFRSSDVRPEEYFALSKRAKADLIWRTLFVENAPLSEATRGVTAVLSAFGLPTDAGDLSVAREFFAAQKLEAHIEQVLKMSGLSEVVMTNDPLDPAEGPLWEAGLEGHAKFHAVLRLDGMLNKWAQNWTAIAAKGYGVDEGCSDAAVAEARRFLADWMARMNPVYAAVSLPDTFRFPEDSIRGRLLAGAVLPACREFGIPLSLMIGVRYLVNPGLETSRRCRGQSGPAESGTDGGELSRQSFPGERAEPREPARTVRLRAQVPQSDGVRLLVVPQPALGGGRDDPRAAGDAGHDVHPAAFRRARSRAAHLQVAEYAPDAGSDSRQHVPAARRRWTSGDAERYPA